MTAADGEAEQLTLADMPTRLFACTPSRLAAFDCPRRYRFTYVDRPPPPRGAPWAHNTVGAIAHLALHRWWSQPRGYRTPDEGASLVERSWQPGWRTAGFRDEQQSDAACALTAGWVRDYLADRSANGLDPQVEPVGVERTVATRTAGLAVSGRVDRIDERATADGDELVVVDYKTGRHVPDTDDARGSQALALYVLGVRRTLRRACRRVELHHLPTGTIAAFEHTDESLDRHVRRAEDTARDITTAREFPPAPGPSCSWCDFRARCPEGRASSPERPAWAGLPETLLD